ncbi:hypothetical protein AWZ03_015001 [Drosophila navojoa]|uniref:Uncharacterized protein n=1 Tax=Drosophila navojoa TaxID=7232 RepID=A0A484AQ60_DRONA|nr:hypothetical protein AWZ03_015001 [Drosophila navojoa]
MGSASREGKVELAALRAFVHTFALSIMTISSKATETSFVEWWMGTPNRPKIRSLNAACSSAVAAGLCCSLLNFCHSSHRLIYLAASRNISDQ